MLSPEQRVELIDVVDVLRNTLENVAPNGVRIERVWGWNQNGVRYVDPENPDTPIKEMSAVAYAAEFYKISGGSLDTADFDDVVGRCAYVGNIVGSAIFESMNIEDLKLLAASNTSTEYSDSGDFC